MSAYPWLADACGTLQASFAAERVPHALLVHDAPGTGGEWLALWAARLMLCAARENKPCGTCQNCQAVSENRHPDVLLVKPIEDSHQIRIEQVRELCDELSLTSHQG